jgi:hypothetical protein
LSRLLQDMFGDGDAFGCGIGPAPNHGGLSRS